MARELGTIQALILAIAALRTIRKQSGGDDPKYHADPGFAEHIENLDAADVELSELLRSLNRVTSDMRSPIKFREPMAVGFAKKVGP